MYSNPQTSLLFDIKDNIPAYKIKFDNNEFSSYIRMH